VGSSCQRIVNNGIWELTNWFAFKLGIVLSVELVLASYPVGMAFAINTLQ
jgi:hypothetical protein